MPKETVRKTILKYSTIEAADGLHLPEVANGRSSKPPLLDVIIEGDARQA